MPPPHPLTALYATPLPYRVEARASVRQTLREALAAHDGDVKATAKTLGIHETTLHRWLTGWGVLPGRGAEKSDEGEKKELATVSERR
jgi:transcriptional regulator of acetoin/glycerol metabolism